MEQKIKNKWKLWQVNARKVIKNIFIFVTMEKINIFANILIVKPQQPAFVTMGIVKQYANTRIVLVHRLVFANTKKISKFVTTLSAMADRRFANMALLKQDASIWIVSRQQPLYVNIKFVKHSAGIRIVLKNRLVYASTKNVKKIATI